MEYSDDINTKEMFNLNSVLADSGSVGDWDGQEELAAEQVNRIYQALYDAAPDNIEPDELARIMQYVWDDWGSNEDLLEITDEQIEKYVSGKF